MADKNSIGHSVWSICFFFVKLWRTSRAKRGEHAEGPLDLTQDREHCRTAQSPFYRQVKAFANKEEKGWQRHLGNPDAISLTNNGFSIIEHQ
jgi:hypothetical protein